MTSAALLELLAAVERGALTPSAAAERLATLPFEDLGHTRLDHHRTLRAGLPEVIFASGKTPGQVAEIFARLAASGVDVLATRVDPATAQRLVTEHPAATHSALARTVALRQSLPEQLGPRPQPFLQRPPMPDTEPTPATPGRIAVVCAGTSDLPVAEEAAITAETFGCQVTRLYDVGVAGLHRLLAVLEPLRAADAIIVCAGMEGALPSVVGGLVAVPVLAVPTSIGYGASFGGAAALLGMLNSCSPNVSVVNIDNGFGAAYSATLIARRSH
jgi:NCAIR mutase (PurE)-related protein